MPGVRTNRRRGGSNYLALHGDARLPLRLQLGRHSLRAVLLVRERGHERVGPLPQARVDKEAVHVRAEHVGANQVAQRQPVQVLLRDELEVVVHRILFVRDENIRASVQPTEKVPTRSSQRRGGGSFGLPLCS